MVRQFGKELRALRLSRGVSLSEVARQVGWSVPYLCDIETGRRSPPAPERIEQIARILGTPDKASELLRLAAQSRGSIVLKLTPMVDPDVAETIILVARAFHEGKLGADVARSIRRTLQRNTAVA